jgi:hypothetical protein
MNDSLSSSSFYNEYYGHTIQDLNSIIPLLRKNGKNSIVFLAGDSSLDNKHWVLDERLRTATNGYENFLEPPKSCPDVCYHLNYYLANNDVPLVCINGAVEESTIEDRSGTKMLPHDVWISDNLQQNDVLIVSVGGNDIALKPTLCTIASIASLVKFSFDSSIENGTAYGMGYLISLFKDGVTHYINQLCRKKKPKLILVCMIYFPHEQASGSWADRLLGMLGYNVNPNRLQLLIRKAFELATSQIVIPDSTVIPVPLFDVLDSRPQSKDYCERVEPSHIGGRKMAKAFSSLIMEHAFA